MRKKIYLFLFLLHAITMYAQPNGGFENWNNEFGYENPDGWQTLNFLSLFTPPSELSSFKAIGTDKHSGNYALKLKTVFIDNQAASFIGDSIGGVFTGKVDLTPFSYKFGYPYTGRPEKLCFWSKYFPVGNDTAAVLVLLKKWNETGVDTVAANVMSIPPSAVYTFYELNLDYHSNTITPDTAVIIFNSSRDTSVARINSTLFIDDVAFTGWVGINNPEKPADWVKVFPNPAENSIEFDIDKEEAELICIYDVFGKPVLVQPLVNPKTRINTTCFASGTYFYEIKDRKDQVVYKERFCITH